MMKTVIINASAYSTMFGGDCCTPSALRTSESTMEIFRNDVVVTNTSGTRPNIASEKVRTIGS